MRREESGVLLTTVATIVNIGQDDLLRLVLTVQSLAVAQRSHIGRKIPAGEYDPEDEKAYLKAERVQQLVSSLLRLDDQFAILEALIEMARYAQDAAGIDLSTAEMTQADMERMLGRVISQATSAAAYWRRHELIKCPHCPLRLPSEDLLHQGRHMTTYHPKEIARELSGYGFQPDGHGGYIDTQAGD